MTDRQIDQNTKENKKKMSQQQKAAKANKSKSTTSPLVRKPTGSTKHARPKKGK